MQRSLNKNQLVLLPLPIINMHEYALKNYTNRSDNVQYIVKTGYV